MFTNPKYLAYYKMIYANTPHLNKHFFFAFIQIAILLLITDNT